MELIISDTDPSFCVLFHRNPNPMWIVEVDTLRFKAVNQAAIDHYGYTEEEFLTSITLARIRPIYEQQEMLDLIRSIKHNQTIRKELQHVKKDGAIIYVNITSYTVKYHDCYCRMVMIHDVTEQKIKDKKLTEAVAKINETLESITDGFITLDGKLRVTYWNKEAERILAIKRETVLHQKLWKLYPYYNELSLFKQLGKALRSHQTVKFEEFIGPIDKWLCFTAYPGNDGVAVYFQDITRQKRGEELINQQNEGLDRIAFMNSHLIRKPLANILGIIHAMDDTDKDVEHSLMLLRSCATELDGVIRDINQHVERTIK